MKRCESLTKKGVRCKRKVYKKRLCYQHCVKHTCAICMEESETDTFGCCQTQFCTQCQNVKWKYFYTCPGCRTKIKLSVNDMWTTLSEIEMTSSMENVHNLTLMLCHRKEFKDMIMQKTEESLMFNTFLFNRLFECALSGNRDNVWINRLIIGIYGSRISSDDDDSLHYVVSLHNIYTNDFFQPE